jgi:hypothetical protein
VPAHLRPRRTVPSSTTGADPDAVGERSTEQGDDGVPAGVVGSRPVGDPRDRRAQRPHGGEVWPRDAAPPAITLAFVPGLGVPGAVVEIETVAAVSGA